MTKYGAFDKEFIARCKKVKMPYAEFGPLAKRILGLDVPSGTYDMQRSYLKHRSPADMGGLPTVSLSKLVKRR